MAIKGVFFFDFNRSITYNLLIMNGLQRITATKFPFDEYLNSTTTTKFPLTNTKTPLRLPNFHLTTT